MTAWDLSRRSSWLMPDGRGRQLDAGHHRHRLEAPQEMPRRVRLGQLLIDVF